MSRAVTMDIVFKGRIASFMLRDEHISNLSHLFSVWLAEQAKDNNFIVWSTQVDSKVLDRSE